MTIENILGNLVEAVMAQTAAIEENTAAIQAAGGAVVPTSKAATKTAPAKVEKPAKAKAKPAPEPEDDGGFGDDEEEGDSTEVTQDDVKVALQRFAKQESKQAAMDILKKYGVTNIAKLDAGDFGPIIEEVEALLA